MKNLTKLLKEYTDVIGGRMTLEELHTEIKYLMTTKKPSQVILTIERRETGYFSKLYIPTNEFYPKKIRRKDDGEILERNRNGTYSFVKSLMADRYRYSYESLMNTGKFEDIR